MKSGPTQLPVSHPNHKTIYPYLTKPWYNVTDSEGGEQLHKEVTAAHPDHLAAQLARLQSLDTPAASATAQGRAAVVAAAAKIVAAVDVAPLLAFYGTKNDTRPEAPKIKTQVRRMNIFF